MTRHTDPPRHAKVLVLSSMALAAASQLADAARRRGWDVLALDRSTKEPPIASEVVFYGSTLEATKVMERFGLALLEPPLDLLARLPMSLLLRRVNFTHWDAVSQMRGPLFLKPADPLYKVFDAGVYRERSQIRIHKAIPPATPVLVADPVEWLAEYRCFILKGEIVAHSPYLSFGRPLHHSGSTTSAIPTPVLDVCRRLASLAPSLVPPAFVADVGLIEDRGWAVVELNPAWCAGLLSANASNVLDVLQRSCCRRQHLSPIDRPWVIHRTPTADDVR